MFNSTTIGAGLGSSPSRLLAWGLGRKDATVVFTGLLYSTSGTAKPYLEAPKVTSKTYIEMTISSRKEIQALSSSKKYFQEGMASKSLIEVSLTAKEEV